MEVEVFCNAGYGEVTPERTNSRNGYRARQLDTRVGSIDSSIPKLREGSYYPGWLLEPRRRAERALVAVVAECYVRGVSTRRAEGLVQTLVIESLSKSQVSRMAKELDAQVAAFRNPPLDGGPYTYVSLDAMTQKVREGGRIVNVAVVIAVGVNAEGHREVLGFDVITTEDGAGWLAFLRGLVARGLAGTTLVISDAHPRLVDAVRSTLTGATWQRCRIHFMRNLLTRVPKSAQAMVATDLTYSIAVQYGAQKIRCNTIITGLIVHEGTGDAHQPLVNAIGARQLTRLGQPADIAYAAAYLASREAQFVTGVLLPVDGGLTCGLRLDVSELLRSRD